jgi:hypothetical protein
VAHQVLRLEQCRHVEALLETSARYGLDGWIRRPWSQIHKRAVKRNLQTAFVELSGRGRRIPPGGIFQSRGVKADLGIDPPLHKKRKVPILEIGKRNVDLDLFQHVSHEQKLCLPFDT